MVSKDEILGWFFLILIGILIGALLSGAIPALEFSFSFLIKNWWIAVVIALIIIIGFQLGKERGLW